MWPDCCSFARKAAGARSRFAARSAHRAGARLGIIELAVAVVLLAGGVLLARSLYGVLHVNVGLEASHVALLAVDVPGSYKGNAQLVALQRRVIDRVHALPGVEAAGTTSTRPLQGGNTNWIRVGGRPYHGEHNEVNAREVDDGYF